MSLAPYVRAMGRGPGRARSLERSEAFDAMQLILKGDAEPEAVGALLMLMRYRGETAHEIAGMVEAARSTLTSWQNLKPAIDWPSYAAGRSRGLPWFLLSAKLLARAGYPVLIHGWNSHQSSIAAVRPQLQGLNIPTAVDPQSAKAALATHNIAFVPLEELSSELFDLLRLRDKLGLRSCINTILRMLNPGQAQIALQGVFHPSYRLLQQDAGALLGQRELLVIKGAGGEFERHPGKTTALFGLTDQEPFESDAPAKMDATHKLANQNASPSDLIDLWNGQNSDPFATRIVVGTAALALWRAARLPDLANAEALALELWSNRLAPHHQANELCA